jgi:hypothetical protein
MLVCMSSLRHLDLLGQTLVNGACKIHGVQTCHTTQYYTNYCRDGSPGQREREREREREIGSRLCCAIMNRLDRPNMDLITSYCATSPDAGHNGIARCDRLCFDCWRQNKIRWAQCYYTQGKQLSDICVKNWMESWMNRSSSSQNIDKARKYEELDEGQRQLVHDFETRRSARALNAAFAQFDLNQQPYRVAGTETRT